MEYFVTIFFWLSMAGIVITYLVYPFWVIKWHFKENEPASFEIEDDLPEVTVIMAAYNEASVIEEKIKSVFETTYPRKKLTVLVGSDQSTDETDAILIRMMQTIPELTLLRFEQRTGKSGIINSLVAHSKSPIIIATDANILFEEETIFHLVKRFKQQEIDLVGGNIIYQDIKDVGIAAQEHAYLNIENRIKQAESKRWWLALGVEGGCYAIRRKAFAQIPPLTFMEDFYITMAVLSKGGKVWFEPEAKVYEDVSTQMGEEFKRKIRISIGNWQNLNRFSGLIFKPFYPLGMAFLAHKVLRWLTPFFAIFAFGAALVLARNGNFYSIFVTATLAVLLLLPFDYLLMKRNLHTGVLRFINHFFTMNIALLLGFIEYAKGVKSNVWQPTKRNQ